MAQASRNVIAVYSPKGGVGKTTFAVELAWRFAAFSKVETLLWDMDPQGGAAYLLDEPACPFGNAAGIFQKEGRPEHHIVSTRYDYLDMIRADDSLRNLPWQLARLGRKNRLAEITGKLKHRYARIVLDCPPMQNEVSNQILLAADVVVVPLPPSPLSARALDLLQQDLQQINGRHPPILPVLSMYDGRRREHQLARSGQMADYPVIPLSAEIERVAFKRAPLPTFAPNCAASQAIDRLWRGIEQKFSAHQAPVYLPSNLSVPHQGYFVLGRLANWLG